VTLELSRPLRPDCETHDAAADMRGRGSQTPASRKTRANRHGFGAAEAGFCSAMGAAGIEHPC
jgi:hypothetical protein